MKLKLKRVLVLLLSLLLVLQTPLTALAKSDHAYKTEDPGVTVSFVPSDSGDRSLYEVILQNNSEKTITDWEVSFKTNFGLTGVVDVLYEKTRNNTYCFCDPENRTLPHER